MNTNTRNPWPIGIVIFLVGFVALVVFAGVRISQHHFDLVSPDYYENEIAYEDHLESTRRADDLGEKPQFGIEDSPRVVWLRFPEAIRRGAENVSLHLYYPADRHQDLRIDVDLTEGTELRVPLGDRPGGNWRVHLQWEREGRAYRHTERMDFPQ